MSDLVVVDFDLSVPPFCPAAKPLLPNYHQPRQSWASNGTIKFQVNQTKSTTRWDYLYYQQSSFALHCVQNASDPLAEDTDSLQRNEITGNQSVTALHSPVITTTLPSNLALFSDPFIGAMMTNFFGGSLEALVNVFGGPLRRVEWKTLR